MATVPTPRPLYVGTGNESVFAYFHPPAGSVQRGRAVLIVPPWGWEEVASYRSRRSWADHLAEAGHPVLRVDLPATGDSAGSPGDPGRVDAWIEAVRMGGLWLAAETGRPVAAIGLSLGGLLAIAAVERGAPISQLILWAVPASGRDYLRSQRAFANLQTSRDESSGPAPATTLPPGWMEIGGFVLSAESILALESLPDRLENPGALERVLLLDRDGIAPSRGVREGLESVGVKVTVQPGRGWEAMCFHPERYAPPLEVFDRVGRWLAAGPRTNAAVTSQAPSAATSLELTIDGVSIRETPILVRGPSGNEIFAILAEPAVGPRAAVGGIFLNAGAVRRIGPNRLWVEAARRWAARAVTTLRIDIEGIGDADGDGSQYRDVGRFYVAEHGADVDAAIAVLADRATNMRIVTVGLCSGAYWAFHAAAANSLVEVGVLLNPRALVWDAHLETRRQARRVGSILRRGLWRRIVTGQVSRAAAATIARATLVHSRIAIADAARRLLGRAGQPDGEAIAGVLDRLDRRGGRLVLAFSGDEPLENELDRDGGLAILRGRRSVTVETLPGSDHTVRPVEAQAAVSRLLDRELERAISQPGTRFPVPHRDP